jgi:hypothetical protein
MASTIRRAMRPIRGGSMKIWPNEYFTDVNNCSCIIVHEILRLETDYQWIKLQSCQTEPYGIPCDKDINCFETPSKSDIVTYAIKKQ